MRLRRPTGPEIIDLSIPPPFFFFLGVSFSFFSFLSSFALAATDERCLLTEEPLLTGILAPVRYLLVKVVRLALVGKDKCNVRVPFTSAADQRYN